MSGFDHIFSTTRTLNNKRRYTDKITCTYMWIRKKEAKILNCRDDIFEAAKKKGPNNKY
jgi:hypothetical protein